MSMLFLASAKIEYEDQIDVLSLPIFENISYLSFSGSRSSQQ